MHKKNKPQQFSNLEESKDDLQLDFKTLAEQLGALSKKKRSKRKQSSLSQEDSHRSNGVNSEPKNNKKLIQHLDANTERYLRKV